MPRKTANERKVERVKLLTDIKAGRKHTRRNDILAPLSQAGLISYRYPPGARMAQDIKLTESGEVFLKIEAEDLGITLD